MMLTLPFVSPSLRRPLWITSLVAAGVALSFAFNCAAPLRLSRRSPRSRREAGARRLC